MPGLRERLRDGQPLLGTLVSIPSPVIVELAALAGFDLVVLDTEHGLYGVHELRPMLLAARAHQVVGVVRVRSADPALIGQALDAGADGVLVPHVGSTEQARAAVSAARFAPAGQRGANPFVAAAAYAGESDWYERANREVAVLVMVEGKSGLQAVDDIACVEGVDGVFVGPFDLSHALGVPGQTDHPAVTSAVRRVAEAARRNGTAMGAFAPSIEAAHRLQEAGASFIAYGVDTSLILAGLRDRVKEVRA